MGQIIIVNLLVVKLRFYFHDLHVHLFSMHPLGQQLIPYRFSSCCSRWATSSKKPRAPSFQIG